MEYAVVAFPAAPVRRKPGHQKEMVNQLLFGETVKILKSKKQLWVKVRSLHDGYEGWMTNTLLEEVDEATANQTTGFVSAGFLSPLVAGERTIHIPVGSSLPFFNPANGNGQGNGRIADSAYRYNGPFINREVATPGPDEVRNLAMAWLNAPYLWGGRTPLGVDCSGFVQVIFKMMGIDLPRDAWQQAQEGRSVKKFSEIKTGDLAFFDNKEDIVHVGIMMDKDHIIHASGKVRIDEMTKKGITNPGPRVKPLQLRAIRRLW